MNDENTCPYNIYIFYNVRALCIHKTLDGTIAMELYFYFYTLLIMKIRFEHKQKPFKKNFEEAADTLYYRIDI